MNKDLVEIWKSKNKNIETNKQIEKGSSDLAGSPTTVIGLDNLPSNKLFYNLNQDATASVTKSYTVTVTHSGGTQNFTVTQVVNNELESIRSAVASYYV